MARILVGEDEPLLRGLLTLVLRLEGHTVTAVADGQAALDALTAQDYDLAVLDVRMEGISGLEALERAARAGRAVRALVLTGDDADGEAAAAAERLSARLRTKPLSRAELLAEVNALLAPAAKGDTPEPTAP